MASRSVGCFDISCDIRSTAMKTLVLFLCTLTRVRGSHTYDVCISETFKVQCQPDEVILMKKALYGRMDTGRCLSQGSENIGCSNDVLGFLDQWCSGQNMCDFMPIAKFAQVKTKWCGQMLSFLRAEHTCLKVITKPFSYCASHPNVILTSEEGYLASHVTDKTGCGSAEIPWMIQVRVGETVRLTLLDFGAIRRREEEALSDSECPVVYGFILERSLAINKTLCGSLERNEVVYESSANHVEIHIIPSHKRQNGDHFVLHYRTIGCPDLTPPADAWYKRDGNQATIGCENSDRKWDLVCENNAWSGVVGNCSVAKAAAISKDDKEEFPLKTALMLGGIIFGTICLSVIILVIGIVYMKRYRRKRQASAPPSRRSTLTSLSQGTTSGQKLSSSVKGSRYRPVSYAGACNHGNQRRERGPYRKSYPSARSSYPREAAPRDSNGHYYSHIWEMPLPDPKDKDVTASTSRDNEYLAPRCDQTKNSDVRTTPLQDSTDIEVDDNVSSYYSPNTGHKYYVLDRNITQQQHKQQDTPAPDTH